MSETKEFSIRLKVLDGETGTTRICGPEEAETWDWKNPEIWRVVNGWQVTSYEQLVRLLYEKAMRGIEEVEMLEAPRFTMLSGG
ncbi:MAG TPA: hypothetical protein VGJ94_15845 [Syntrophorhabdaceae bacterium]